jgi:hypothetical protein
MSVSQEISAHLPYMRRFARALVGSREGGDAYVIATLEAVVAEPRRLHDSQDLRVSLYKLFLDIWSAAPVAVHSGAGDALDDAGARHNLDAISLRPRIAFLLNALELSLIHI